MKKGVLIALTIPAVLGFGFLQAEASTYALGTLMNGGNPAGSAPWLTVDFANEGANTVQMTLTSHLSVSGEFISEVVFNETGLLPNSLCFTSISGPTASITHKGFDAQNLTGSGSAGKGFDIKFSFPTSNSGKVDRFNNSDVVVYDIIGTGLTASYFDALNTGSAQAHVGAKLQGIPGLNGGTTSAAIRDTLPLASAPVPIPGAVLLFSSGLVGLVLARKRLTN